MLMTEEHVAEPLARVGDVVLLPDDDKPYVVCSNLDKHYILWDAWKEVELEAHEEDLEVVPPWEFGKEYWYFGAKIDLNGVRRLADGRKSHDIWREPGEGVKW
jgi:hypothetical protein